ncbi:hypothetical protein TNCT_56411 [Trichonephila clavata]|uniref:Uncharacterized protein n=1 Tax=Trichonephila clavata TaxID=2740835 RepID=A0A8X6GPJ8_TRICU|nr:hypothetical protein TNCT_712941 [Trichonephila clavata]GFR08791.1 hypothetical protein TNCT_56411 [Trichonephila clavata]
MRITFLCVTVPRFVRISSFSAAFRASLESQLFRAVSVLERTVPSAQLLARLSDCNYSPGTSVLERTVLVHSNEVRKCWKNTSRMTRALYLKEWF